MVSFFYSSINYFLRIIKLHKILKIKHFNQKQNFNNFNNYIADKPFMEPRKDYEDYSRFINDTYADEKI